MGWVESRAEFLRTHQNTDGGWGYFPGRESRVEPTCYALHALGLDSAASSRGIAFLLARQESTGGLAPAVNVPGATWVTQLAFPLLKRAQVAPKQLEKAADWILSCEGAEGTVMQRVLYAMGKSKVEQDPRLRGWPWRPDNNSWVEPTAHGLVALHWMNGHAPEAGIRYRRDVATRMLLDRRCEDGGWNYGNRKVLGEVLPSYPETTGLALLGLVGYGADLALSLDRARRHLEAARGDYGRALLTLALRLHGQPVEYTPSHAESHPSRNIMLAGLEMLAGQAVRGTFIP
jgi:hypothetical protein